MAAPGQPIDQVFMSTLSPDEVKQRLMSMPVLLTSGTFDRSVLMQTGPQSLTITRSYLPQWALVVAIIGALCALLGLLALLARSTEAVIIDTTPVAGGTQVVVRGVAAAPLASQIAMTLS